MDTIIFWVVNVILAAAVAIKEAKRNPQDWFKARPIEK